MIPWWKSSDPYRVVLLAPLLLALHVIEEAPGFVAWINALLAEGITSTMFFGINAIGVAITVVLALLAGNTREPAALILALGWLSFIFFANAIVHISATFLHWPYAPGVVTATVLYLPYFARLWWLTRKESGMHAIGLTLIVLVSGLPMFIHGYLILFEGRRLF